VRDAIAFAFSLAFAASTTVVLVKLAEAARQR
jgi:hypothetical protein